MRHFENSAPRSASPKQIAFIERLSNEKQMSDDMARRVAWATDGQNFVGMRAASGLIDELLATSRKSATTTSSARRTYVDPPLGIHVINGEYRKVKDTRSGQRVGFVFDGASFEYAGKKGLAGLSDDTVATAEQAAAFGHEHGFCCYCSRGLTDERSTSVGYGPICAVRYGLEWGSVADEEAAA